MKKSKKVKLMATLGTGTLLSVIPIAITACSTIVPPAAEGTVNIYGPKVIYAKTETKQDVNYNASIEPFSIKQGVEWKTSNLPTGATFDNKTGKLTLNLQPGQRDFTFSITAIAKENQFWTSTETVRVAMGYADVESTSIRCVSTLEPGDQLHSDYGDGGIVQFVASNLPEDSNQEVEWEKVSGFENGIELNNSVISWPKTILPKDPTDLEVPYELTFRALASATKGTAKEIRSPEFTFKLFISDPVPKKIQIDSGDTKINVKVNETENYAFGATVYPDGVSQDQTWSCSFDSAVATMSEDGILTVKQNPSEATFPGKVTVKCGGDYDDIYDSIDVTIKISENIPEQVSINVPSEINAVAGTSGECETTFTSSVTPVKADQNVVWSMTNETISEDDISVVATGDTTAKLKWSNNLKPGDYDIFVWADAKDRSAVSSTHQKITLKVARPKVSKVTISGGETTISTVKDITKKIKYQATVAPEQCLQDVTWSINNTYTNQVTINEDTGELTTKFTTAGTYPIVIKAISKQDNTTFGEYNVSISVSEVLPQTINVSGNEVITTDYKKAGTETYTTSIFPANAPQDVTWSIVGEKPTGVDIGASTGIFSYNQDATNPVPVGTFNITLRATANTAKAGEVAIYRDYPIALTVNAPEPSTIDISNIPSGTTQDNPFVWKQQSEYTNQLKATVRDASGSMIAVPQDVTWTLENVPATHTNTIKISDTGLLTITESAEVLSPTQITVKATSKAKNTVYNTASFYLQIITADPTEISVSVKSGATNWAIDATYNASGSATFEASVLPTGANADVTWHAVNVPTGASFDTATATFNYNNTATKVTPGTYKISIWAESVRVPGLVSPTQTLTFTVAHNTPSSIDVKGITDGQNIEVYWGESKTIDLTATVKDGSGSTIGVSQDVTWALSDETIAGISIDHNTGKLKIDTTVMDNQYSGTIGVVVTTADSTVTKTINVNIATPYAPVKNIEISGSREITAIVGTAETEGIVYTANASPDISMIDATWDSPTSLPTGFNWNVNDNEGTLTWGTNTTVGTYVVTLNAKAVDNHQSPEVTVTKSYDIIVKVVDQYPPAPTAITITGDTKSTLNTKIANNATRIFGVSFTGEAGVTTDVNWVLETDPQTIPGVTLTPLANNNAALSTGTELALGDHVVTFHAEDASGTVVSPSVSITISVTANIEIIGVDTVVIDPDKVISNQFTLNNATGTVYWDLEKASGQSGDIPNGIYITADGVLTAQNVSASDMPTAYKTVVRAITEDGNIYTKEVTFQPSTAIVNKIIANDTTEYILKNNMSPSEFAMNQKDDGCWYLTFPLSIGGTGEINTNETKSFAIKSVQWGSGDKTLCANFLRGQGDGENIKESTIQTLDLSGLAGVTSVGDHFLDASFKLKKVDLSPLCNLTKIPNNFMSGCRTLSALDFAPLKNVTEIGDWFLAGSFLSESPVGEDPTLQALDLSPLANITANDKIGKGFLYNCQQLTYVNMGNIKAEYMNNTDNNAFCVDESFGGSHETMPAYNPGITLVGQYVSDIKNKFGDRTDSPWRKLLLG